MYDDIRNKVQEFFCIIRPINLTNELTPGSGVHLEELIVIQLVKKFPTFVEPKVLYLAHKGPKLVITQTEMHPFHNFPPSL